MNKVGAKQTIEAMKEIADRWGRVGWGKLVIEVRTVPHVGQFYLYRWSGYPVGPGYVMYNMIREGL